MATSRTPPFVGCLVKLFHRMIAGVSSLTLIATRLRSLRERHHLSQEQFAESAGISYKFYQAIEAGRRKQIWLETVDRLAAGYGLETWQLLSPEEPMHTIVTPMSRPGAERVVAEAAGKYHAKRHTRPSSRNRSKQPKKNP